MNKKIRVLHLAQCAGGVDCYLRMFFSHIDKRYTENILVCSYDYKQEDYLHIVDEFVQVEMENSLSLRKDGKAIKKVRRLIKEKQPDIIYLHSSKAGGIGRLAAIGLGIPVIYNPHGWAFSMRGSKMKAKIYLWIERLLAPLTTQFVVISNYEKLAGVERHVAKADKMKVIFNGIDFDMIERQLKEFVVTREQLDIPENAYVIGMVGRISAQKAPDVFVRMAAKIKRKLPHAYFMIVGDGDERVEIERLVDTMGLKGCFYITGWTQRPHAYVALMDQCVLLSRWEGFGLVLAEYMRMGKPIVATEINAIPDLIVNYENGILVPPDRPERAAESVIEIYNNKDMREKFISNGLKRADALFNVRRVAMEHEQLFVRIKG